MITGSKLERERGIRKRIPLLRSDGLADIADEKGKWPGNGNS